MGLEVYTSETSDSVFRRIRFYDCKNFDKLHVIMRSIGQHVYSCTALPHNCKRYPKVKLVKKINVIPTYYYRPHSDIH